MDPSEDLDLFDLYVEEVGADHHAQSIGTIGTLGSIGGTVGTVGTWGTSS